MNLNSNMKQIIELLNSEKLGGYAQSPLPSDIDKKFIEIVRIFVKLPPDEREATRRHFSSDDPWPLLAFAERMANLAVRELSADSVMDGLIALAIESCRYDQRETLLILSLLYDSAEKIGMNGSEALKRAALFATTECAQTLEQYARKPATIRSMGYEEMETSTGFAYRRTW